LQFSVANDTANIYVCVKMTDEQAEMSLFRQGFNVWLDPKGKRKEALGISFPTKQERTPGEMEPRQKKEHTFQRTDITRLKQHALLEQITLRVKGFAGAPDQVLPLQNKYGINAAFNWDSLNILTIEYQFPIKIAFGHNFSVADTIKPIGLGLVINAGEAPPRNKEEEPEMQNSSMGGRSATGGMNTGMSGRDGMGSGRQNMNSMSQAPQEQKVWSKIYLTAK